MKENNPTVGISVLTYNYGKYLDELLQSLKQQTYQDFEIYLIDDGSTDGSTQEIVNNIKYDKIKSKILFKKNRGNAICRLEQYKKMNNQYILDLSADDKLDPTFLEKTVQYLDKHPKCGAVSVNIAEYQDDFKKKPFYTFVYNLEKMKFPNMLSECHCLGSSLMRNQALKETDLSGGFKRYQDWDRWISMLEAGWTLGLVEEPLFMYRQHSDSLSHSTTVEIESEVFNKIITKHSELYKKYAIDVVKNFHYRYWEVIEGKNWLEQQYFNMSKEIERLNSIIETNNKPCSLSSRIKSKIKRAIKRK